LTLRSIVHRRDQASDCLDVAHGSNIGRVPPSEGVLLTTGRKFGDPALLGEVRADDYDDRTSLAPLARGGRVLGLAVGIGRVAVPS
jgi:hypothetical protein